MRPFTLFALLCCTIPLPAQDPLSLQEAVETALGRHPAIEASASNTRAADARIRQARSGYLPKLDYSEAFQRSNNPVYVFSSLLTQHQFAVENFEIGRLNRPDALNNFQSLLTAEQILYDAGRTKKQVEAAEIGRNLASEDERGARMSVILGVVRAYYGAVLANEGLQVAREAVRSAEADLERAEAVRQAGMSTDADVLSIRVHLAAMREQEIRRVHELDVARAALNEALGLPLETPHQLTTPLAAASVAYAPELEKSALSERPEARQSDLRSRLARTQADGARAAYFPQVFARGVFEADRQRFVTRGGANWMFAAGLRWNLFNGFADRARIEEAGHAAAAAQSQQEQTSRAVQLQVRGALSNLSAAEERIKVAEAAVGMAEESLRITKNRFDNGLSTVTDLLRNETALLEARMRHLSAIHDQRVAAAAVERAAGTLSTASNVLR